MSLRASRAPKDSECEAKCAPRLHRGDAPGEWPVRPPLQLEVGDARVGLGHDAGHRGGQRGALAATDVVLDDGGLGAAAGHHEVAQMTARFACAGDGDQVQRRIQRDARGEAHEGAIGGQGRVERGRAVAIGGVAEGRFDILRMRLQRLGETQHQGPGGQWADVGEVAAKRPPTNTSQCPVSSPRSAGKCRCGVHRLCRGANSCCSMKASEVCCQRGWRRVGQPSSAKRSMACWRCAASHGRAAGQLRRACPEFGNPGVDRAHEAAPAAGGW